MACGVSCVYNYIYTILYNASFCSLLRHLWQILLTRMWATDQEESSPGSIADLDRCHSKPYVVGVVGARGLKGLKGLKQWGEIIGNGRRNLEYFLLVKFSHFCLPRMGCQAKRTVSCWAKTCCDPPFSLPKNILTYKYMPALGIHQHARLLHVIREDAAFAVHCLACPKHH